MSQTPTPFCVQCGTQNPLGQPFCSNCGARQDVNNPNGISSSQNNLYGAPYQQDASSSQYGGYQQSAPSTQYGEYQQGAPSAQYGGYQQSYQQPYQQQPPLYARPQQNADDGTTGIVAAFLGLLLLREVKTRIIGCVFTLIIVGAIVACALIANH